MRAANDSISRMHDGGSVCCCGYGADGKKEGYDCLMIPSAAKAADDVVLTKYEGGFCGNGGLVSSNSKASTDTPGKVTICCKYSVSKFT